MSSRIREEVKLPSSCQTYHVLTKNLHQSGVNTLWKKKKSTSLIFWNKIDFTLHFSITSLLSLSKCHRFCCVFFSEDSWQENGVHTNHYSSISPPASPVPQEEPFSTYFEEKVHIPEAPNTVPPYI